MPARAFFRCHQPDLRQPTCHLTGRFDVLRQGYDPYRQSRIIQPERRVTPEGGRVMINGQIEIVAQGCTKCCLIAALNFDLVEHGRKVLVEPRIQHLGQRPCFRFDAGKCGLGIDERRARCTFLLPRCNNGKFSLRKRAFSLLYLCLGSSKGALCFVNVRCCRQSGVQRLRIALNVSCLGI